VTRCLLSGLALLAFLASSPRARAYTEPPLESYIRLSPDRAFVFVMLHPPHGRVPDPINEKYPRSGLYRNDGSTTPLWTFDDGYVREAYPASDGVHVVVQYRRVISPNVRDCGNSPPEPPANPEVLGFYAGGKKIRDVHLGEVLDHVRFCRKHGPGWHSWLASARIDDAAGTLIVETTADTRREIDLKTGHPIHSEWLAAAEPVWSVGVLALGIVLAVVAVAGTVVAACIFLFSRR
jgi:hypothetical protein